MHLTIINDMVNLTKTQFMLFVEISKPEGSGSLSTREGVLA